MLEKTCSRCGRTKPTEEFNRNRSKSDGRQSYCRACAGIDGVEYRGNNREEISAREANYRASHRREKAALAVAYCRRNPDRIKARKAVSHAIAAGRMAVGPCEDCGLEALKIDNRQRIEAHHHKGYDEEFRLDVVFLCVSCHGLRG